MISSGCFFSDHCDEVSCSGQETWTRLSELKNKTINSKAFPQAENVLEVILPRADIFFQHKFDVENAFVCDAHHKTLLRQVASSDSKKCDTCKSVRKVASCAKTNLQYITISQAMTLFKSFNLRNSYGKLICTKCRLEISNKTNKKIRSSKQCF